MDSNLFVVGLGNIGSQLVSLLASVASVRRVGLVDFDSYTPANVLSQRIANRDAGRAKAHVQARALRATRPDLEVTPYVHRFEQVPLGLLRSSVIFSCVDSRAARQQINRAAVALGIAWIDAGIARAGSVRARAYIPAHACLECAWGPRDYELLEASAPCGHAPATSSTAAPVELGAIAAGLQLMLYRRLITDADAHAALADRQWLLDLPSGRALTATYSPNPGCRHAHVQWEIRNLPVGSAAMSLREALALANPSSGEATLAAPGMAFVRRLRCPKCPNTRRVHGVLSGRLAPRACETCGIPMQATALDTDYELGAVNATTAVLRAPLSGRGFVAGDIVSVHSNAGTNFYQLA